MPRRFLSLDGSLSRHGLRTPCTNLPLWFVLAFAPAFLAPTLSAEAGPAADPSRRPGAPGMLEPHTESLLEDYFEAYLRDQDIDAFRRQVSARYTDGTLARLIDSPKVQARRAALLALGLFGGFEVNAAVARGLRDPDPTVRRLADNALWAIWFRADTPENNAALERVSDLVHQQRFEEAIAQASRLIERAPRFAEAYNQRAIARFLLGRFEESAADCAAVLVRNPYHFGALGGLAQCQFRLGRRAAAVTTLKQASKLQPFNRELTEQIAALEGETP
jgi:tetratricopeptide (TPR) repeat protein